MKTVNMLQAKSSLSRLVADLKEGREREIVVEFPPPLRSRFRPAQLFASGTARNTIPKPLLQLAISEGVVLIAVRLQDLPKSGVDRVEVCALDRRWIVLMQGSHPLVPERWFLPPNNSRVESVANTASSAALNGGCVGRNPDVPSRRIAVRLGLPFQHEPCRQCA